MTLLAVTRIIDVHCRQLS